MRYLFLIASSALNFQPTNVNPQGLTALIRNLGRDCPPTQYLREFVKNSIEACQRTHRSDSQICLDFNSLILERSGFYKLSFTDNGDGMTPEQMLSLLNNLSASGTQNNQHQNYGVGAKISAMTRNHAGIQYESWKDGKGYCVFIRYKPDEDVFGVQGFITGSGEPIYAIPLTDEERPDIIETHGTRVTLFGMTEDQDTMIPPAGVQGTKDDWIVQYLNNRFFTLPDNIMIEARYGYAHPITDIDHNYLEPIVGYREIANRYAQDYGQMRVSDAMIYWWILPEDSPLSGHTALINQDEIFDVSDARSNRLAHFGILVGRNRIIIYVEPDEAVQNTPRTGLVKPNGSSLNWNGWQDEFRNKLPAQIANFLDSLLNETAQVSHTTAIIKRLQALKALFILGGYQQLKVVPKKTSAKESEDIPAINLVSGIDQVEPPAKNESDKQNQDRDSELAEEGEVDSDFNLFPTVEWTNEERSPQIAGRAAEYNEATNIVLANRDFKGFVDLITFFTNKYADNAQVSALIISAVNEGVEQALMECIAGALSLKAQPHWSAHHIHLSLTPEALTTALMQRYWMASYVDQVIRKKLAQERATAAA